MQQKNQDIEKAAAFLREGKLVAIPTETVYGLAANAFDSQAVANIFKAKKRPFFDPLIVHTDSLEKVRTFVKEIPEKAEILANTFWAGAITLVLPKSDKISDIVTSGLDSVAVRIPNHQLTLSLLSKLDFPLAAPSANPFGYVSPTKAEHVASHLGNEVAYILDGGSCEIGIESTIVGFKNGEATILRKGGTSIEAIEKVIGKVKVQAHSSSKPQAPGMLKSHYAPKIPVIIGTIENLIAESNYKRIGVLSFQKKYKIENQELQTILSPKGDLSEAAHNLFAALRKFDNLPADVIYTELLPEIGLGVAINDRIKRAAASA